MAVARDYLGREIETLAQMEARTGLTAAQIASGMTAPRAAPVTPNLERAQRAVARAATALNEVTLPVPKQAASELQRLVATALLDNLAAAGIRTRTGALRAAVNAVEVHYGRGRLWYALPSGLPELLHRYANALNYGWTRTPGGRLSKGARRKLMRAVRQGAVVGGQVRVIPPRPYWQLTPAQEAAVIAEFAARCGLGASA